MADEIFEGHLPRECGEHRTTGGRAWCFGCSEWCYPEQPCKGCELPMLRARLERLEKATGEIFALEEHYEAEKDEYARRHGRSYFDFEDSPRLDGCSIAASEAAEILRTALEAGK